MKAHCSPEALRRIALVAWLGAPTLHAQAPASDRLQGRIITADSVAVPDADLTIADPQGRTVSARTDQAGQFSVPLLGLGRLTVQVRALGFAPLALPVDARQRPVPSLTLTLVRAALTPVQVIGVTAGTRTLHPGASDLAGSVSVLSGEQIAREQVTFAQELLKKVPGVYRAEFNQGIINGDIGLRGFNTESDIASTKLLIDGIPSNMNSGVSEMNALFPLEISQIEVVRGTNDPRYGLFNLAGNISLTTPRGGNYFTSRLQAGSFGTSEVQMLHGIERGGLSQTLFMGTRRTDGYRDNSDLSKWSMSGKWFYTTPSGKVRAGVIARTHRLDTSAPGYLTRAESRATPRLSPVFSASDGGTVASDHGSLHVDVQQTTTLAWSLRAYLQRFDRIRYVRFTAAGAQQERLEDENQRGALATVTWRPATLAAQKFALTAGFDLQQQGNLQQRYRAVEQARQLKLRDYDFSLDNFGGYVQVSVAPVRRLQLSGGLRLDRFSGDFTDNTTTTVRRLPALRFGWVPQPRASVALLLSDRASIYANAGRSFQIGTGIAAYGTQPLQESLNDGEEAGVVTTPFQALSVRAGVWRQRASDEVRLRFDNSGDSENIGRTRRTGVDVEATLRMPRQVSLWATGTSQRAILVDPGPTNPTARGKQLNHVPRWTAKYGADWSPRTGARAAVWAYTQGDYELTPQNDRGRFGAAHVMNLDLTVRVRSASLGLGVTNLFDRYVEYVWWDGTQTLHSPANRRGLFLSVGFDR
jgi:iron complex outermembrane recepter protein